MVRKPTIAILLVMLPSFSFAQDSTGGWCRDKEPVVLALQYGAQVQVSAKTDPKKDFTEFCVAELQARVYKKTNHDLGITKSGTDSIAWKRGRGLVSAQCVVDDKLITKVQLTAVHSDGPKSACAAMKEVRDFIVRK